ncbi:MAG: hypothetical protein U0W24_19135 [Bacteroidales bacterium]
MKRFTIYIALFLAGILIGSLLFIDKSFIFDNKNVELQTKQTVWQAEEVNKDEFRQSAYKMLGKSIIVKGKILEVYKNQYNESVIYLKDHNIPITINCAVFNSDLLIKEPFRLGEEISLQGKFTEIGDEMHLDQCMILDRPEKAR